MSRSWRWIAAVFVAIVTACTLQTHLPPGGVSPGVSPEPYYHDAASAGKNVFHVVTDRSLAVILVRRGGMLAHLGHDHVVASRSIQGHMIPTEGIADLEIPLAKLTVDEPELRAEAGLDTQPSEDAINGTRDNMLHKVLHVEQCPFALVHIIRHDAGESLLKVSITLCGNTRSYEVPALIRTTDAGEIDAAGKMAFNQSDFGIAPLSILGGALQVQDRLEMKFHIVASKGL